MIDAHELLRQYPVAHLPYPRVAVRLASWAVGGLALSAFGLVASGLVLGRPPLLDGGFVCVGLTLAFAILLFGDRRVEGVVKAMVDEYEADYEGAALTAPLRWRAACEATASRGT